MVTQYLKLSVGKLAALCDAMNLRPWPVTLEGLGTPHCWATDCCKKIYENKITKYNCKIMNYRWLG